MRGQQPLEPRPRRSAPRRALGDRFQCAGSGVLSLPSHPPSSSSPATSFPRARPWEPQRSGSLPRREEGAARALPAGNREPTFPPAGRARELRAPTGGSVLGGSHGHACGACGPPDASGGSFCPRAVLKKVMYFPGEQLGSGRKGCWIVGVLAYPSRTSDRGCPRSQDALGVGMG